MLRSYPVLGLLDSKRTDLLILIAPTMGLQDAKLRHSVPVSSHSRGLICRTERGKGIRSRYEI